jgi:hypothetical protein
VAGLGALSPSFAHAAGRVTVMWDASPGTNVITNYKIYYGAVSGTYTNWVSAGTATSVSISNLVGGLTYYFAATATDNYGLESDYSAEASALIPVILPNQPPTLDPIVNLTLNENASSQTVSLTGITSGATNENQTLVVTTASSNPSLIPTPSVSYVSPSKTGSISFAPVLFGYGSSVLTVTVDDGATNNNTISRAFTVTVNPVNLAPTLNPLADVAINENAGVQVIGLSGIGSGAPNETQTLTITATSSDTSLIPTPTVTYASPDTTGSISFAPVAYGFGSATITVTVNDGGASNNVVSRAFLVTVASVNQAPTLDPLSSLTISQNSGPQVVNLSGISAGASNETQPLVVTASSSNPSLIPAPTVSYVSPGSTGSITFSPVTNANGSAVITVVVSDGATKDSTVSRAFTVTVTPAPPGAPACNYSLLVSPTAFTANAASGTFSVTTSGGCNWNLTAPAWMTFSLTNGSSSAAGTFTIDANAGDIRTALVQLSGDSTNVTCVVTQQAVAVGAVALASPLDGATSQTTTPHFSWVPSDPAATKYYLLVNRDGTKQFDLWVDGTTNCCAPGALPGGNYTWAVQSWVTNTPGTWSTNSAFAVPVTAPNGTIALLSPVGSATTSGALRFSWKTDPAATRYQLHIEKDGTVFFDQLFNLADSVMDPSTGEFAVALAQVSSGTYVWWVRGWSSAGYGPWSDRARAIVYRP